MEFFTGWIFLANRAYVQAFLTWCLIIPFLYKARASLTPACVMLRLVLPRKQQC